MSTLLQQYEAQLGVLRDEAEAFAAKHPSPSAPSALPRAGKAGSRRRNTPNVSRPPSSPRELRDAGLRGANGDIRAPFSSSRCRTSSATWTRRAIAS
jgi:hypothetical protein